MSVITFDPARVPSFQVAAKGLLGDTQLRKNVRHATGVITNKRRIVVGEIRVYSISTHPHCNWRADPSGTVREVEVAERAIDLLSAQHPIVG